MKNVFALLLAVLVCSACSTEKKVPLASTNSEHYSISVTAIKGTPGPTAMQVASAAKAYAQFQRPDSVDVSNVNTVGLYYKKYNAVVVVPKTYHNSQLGWRKSQKPVAYIPTM